MPQYHSFTEIRRQLERTIVDPKKREFVLGYLEGHTEHRGKSSSPMVSEELLNEALGKLSVGRQSGVSRYRQITPTDVAKIQKRITPPKL
jgi:hypothetical protein